jgi:hypothetical protein
MRLFEHLPQHPIITIASAVKPLGTTKPTGAKAVMTLADAGVLEEITGRRRDRTFAYTAFLDTLCKGTEVEIAWP